MHKKSMFRPQFVNNEIYHAYNRGTDKRKTFMDDADRFRFIHDLFEFNDARPAPPPNIRFHLRKPSTFTTQCFDVGRQNIEFELRQEKQEGPRKLLVEILVWCLMSNHYHLLVRQLVEGGISLFMKKLGGYTKYFNGKYERSGVLFQGKFQAVLVKSEAHFMHLPFYIHSNPLDAIEPGWRQGDIKDYQKAMKFLESNRFSSHMDYIGKKNFPSVSQREFLLDIFNGTAGYKKQYQEWLKEMSEENLEELEGIILE